MRVAPPGLEQVDDLPDAGLLLIERRVPQPALHVPGQVELAGALGEQVMRDAGLVRAGPAEERPGVDGELAAAPGAQERRAEPARRAAADEDRVVLAVVLVRRGHVPQALGVVLRVRDDVVDQRGPLTHGQRGAVRATVALRHRPHGTDPGSQGPEPVARVPYIDHRSPLVAACAAEPRGKHLPAVQHHGPDPGGAGPPGRRTAIPSPRQTRAGKTAAAPAASPDGRRSAGRAPVSRTGAVRPGQRQSARKAPGHRQAVTARRAGPAGCPRPGWRAAG